jgi:hypothetical protein
MQTLFIRRHTNWNDTPRPVIVAMTLLIGYLLSSGIAHSEGSDDEYPARAGGELDLGHAQVGPPRALPGGCAC